MLLTHAVTACGRTCGSSTASNRGRPRFFQAAGLSTMPPSRTDTACFAYLQRHKDLIARAASVSRPCCVATNGTEAPRPPLARFQGSMILTLLPIAMLILQEESPAFELDDLSSIMIRHMPGPVADSGYGTPSVSSLRRCT